MAEQVDAGRAPGELSAPLFANATVVASAKTVTVRRPGGAEPSGAAQPPR